VYLFVGSDIDKFKLETHLQNAALNQLQIRHIRLHSKYKDPIKSKAHMFAVSCCACTYNIVSKKRRIIFHRVYLENVIPSPTALRTMYSFAPQKHARPASTISIATDNIPVLK